MRPTRGSGLTHAAVARGYESRNDGSRRMTGRGRRMRTAVLVERDETGSVGLPRPRGELSAATIDALRGDLPWDRLPAVRASSDEDGLLTAWIAHELHHRGLPQFQDAEWTPELLT